MCGIVGQYNLNGAPIKQTQLVQMRDKLFHRGPDDAGMYIDGNFGFAFRRLSIIDLSPLGHQPMCNEDETIWIVFNGEIYNFQELRTTLEQKGHRFKSQTDTEVIIHAYEEFGVQCLDYLDGMFAFAIWDGRRRELFLARDRFGIKPLHYYHKNGLFAFGSEIKALLPISDFSRDLDYQAVWNYFTLMQIPAPQTIYKDIRKFLPAQAMVVKADGSKRTWQYWDINIEEDFSKSEEQWVEELRDLFEKAMRRHLYADVPVGVFLSGGLDSSGVVAYASKVSKEPVKTFSVSFSEDKQFDESPYQRLVAVHFKTEHYEFQAKADILKAAELLIKECDEPFAVSSAIPLYYISKLASEHVKVVLSGDGGDEIFAGYNWRYNFANRLGKLDYLPRKLWQGVYTTSRYLFPENGSVSVIGRRLRRISDWGRLNQDERYLSIFNFFTTSQKEKLLHPDIVRDLQKNYGDYYQQVFRKAPEESVNRKLYIDLKTSLADEMLTKSDRCTSMVSIEGRIPLMDKNFVEAAFMVPAGMKLNEKEGKLILKKVFAELLPEEIFKRPKAGFNVPVGRWMKPDLFVNLLDQHKEYLDSNYIQSLLKANEQGEKDWGHHLFIVYQFLIWLNRVDEP